MENPFEHEQLDDHAILRKLYEKTCAIETQVKLTNGRVSSLERWKYATVGGLAVVSTVIVPLFIKMVAS